MLKLNCSKNLGGFKSKLFLFVCVPLTWNDFKQSGYHLSNIPSSFIVSECSEPGGFSWHYHMICSEKHTAFRAFSSFPAVFLSITRSCKRSHPLYQIRASLVPWGPPWLCFAEMRWIGQLKRLSSGWPAAIKSSPAGYKDAAEGRPPDTTLYCHLFPQLSTTSWDTSTWRVFVFHYNEKPPFKACLLVSIIVSLLCFLALEWCRY